MLRSKDRPLNRLDRDLPDGILVDTGWLKRRGFSPQLLSHYVRVGWLNQPTRGVYRRPRGWPLTWMHVLASLRTYLQYPLALGGRTALELSGYGHFVGKKKRLLHVYAPKPPPGWLLKLKLDARFAYRNDQRLFRTYGIATEFKKLVQATPDDPDSLSELSLYDFHVMDNLYIAMSTPERALLEMLDELPKHETFHQIDMLVQGLTSLSPHRLDLLLADCRSVKAKRLFFFFADRHGHAWLKQLKKEKYDLGKGKRMLVKGGKLDPTYEITVPEDLNGIS